MCARAALRMAASCHRPRHCSRGGRAVTAPDVLQRGRGGMRRHLQRLPPMLWLHRPSSPEPALLSVRGVHPLSNLLRRVPGLLLHGARLFQLDVVGHASSGAELDGGHRELRLASVRAHPRLPRLDHVGRAHARSHRHGQDCPAARGCDRGLPGRDWRGHLVLLEHPQRSQPGAVPVRRGRRRRRIRRCSH